MDYSYVQETVPDARDAQLPDISLFLYFRLY